MVWGRGPVYSGFIVCLCLLMMRGLHRSIKLWSESLYRSLCIIRDIAIDLSCTFNYYISFKLRMPSVCMALWRSPGTPQALTQCLSESPVVHPAKRLTHVTTGLWHSTAPWPAACLPGLRPLSPLSGAPGLWLSWEDPGWEEGLGELGAPVEQESSPEPKASLLMGTDISAIKDLSWC